MGCLRLQHHPSSISYDCKSNKITDRGERFKISFAMDPLSDRIFTSWEETWVQALCKESLASQAWRNELEPHNHRTERTGTHRPNTDLQPAQGTLKFPYQQSFPEITDLCSVLRSTITGDLGVAVDQESNHRALISRDTTRETKRFINLADIIRGSQPNAQQRSPSNETLTDLTTPSKLTRDERYRLALVVASSVLQLCKTPWIRKLSTRDVSFWVKFDPQGGSQWHYDLGRPCILHGDWQVTSNPSNRSSFGYSREVLFRLAVILLELCFGQLMHEQPFYAAYCGPNKQPHDQTDRSAANRWCDDVMGEAGPQFFEAIRRCLDCNFGLVNPDFDDNHFLQLVYDNVVGPLRQTGEAMSSTSFPFPRDDEINWRR